MKTLAIKKISEFIEGIKEALLGKKEEFSSTTVPQQPAHKSRKKKSLLQEEDAHLFI